MVTKNINGDIHGDDKKFLFATHCLQFHVGLETLLKDLGLTLSAVLHTVSIHAIKPCLEMAKSPTLYLNFRSFKV